MLYLSTTAATQDMFVPKAPTYALNGGEVVLVLRSTVNLTSETVPFSAAADEGRYVKGTIAGVVDLQPGSYEYLLREVYDGANYDLGEGNLIAGEFEQDIVENDTEIEYGQYNAD